MLMEKKPTDTFSTEPSVLTEGAVPTNRRAYNDENNLNRIRGISTKVQRRYGC